MAPRGRPRKVWNFSFFPLHCAILFSSTVVWFYWQRLSRMDAATDAMTTFGFEERLIQKTVKQLLKVSINNLVGFPVLVDTVSLEPWNSLIPRFSGLCTVLLGFTRDFAYLSSLFFRNTVEMMDGSLSRNMATKNSLKLFFVIKRAMMKTLRNKRFNKRWLLLKLFFGENVLLIDSVLFSSFDWTNCNCTRSR